MAIKPLKAEKVEKAVEPDASPYHVLEEQPTHFVVAHAAEPDKAFRVAKFGLGHKSLTHMRSLLPHMDKGGETPNDLGVLANTPTGHGSVTPIDFSSMSAPSPSFNGDQGDSTNPLDYQAGGAQTQPTEEVRPTSSRGTAGDSTISAPVSNEGEGGEGGSSNAPRPFSGDLSSSWAAPMADGPYGPDEAAKKAAAKPGQTYFGGPDQSKKVDAFTRQMNESDTAHAKVIGELGKKQADIQQWNINQQNAIQQQYQVQRAGIQKELDNTINDIKNFKLDPDRHWGTGGTQVVRKTLAGIGMLISGAGAGMAGQQNMALQVINKAIDRDIDAQKTDLGNKNNLVGMYFKQYGNINDAETRARLDLHTNVQAQLEMAMANAKGPEAQASLGRALAENGMKGLQAIDHLATSRAQRDMMGQEAALKRQEFQMRKEQQDMLNSIYGNVGAAGRGGADSISPDTFAGLQRFDKDTGEKWAKADDGRFYRVTSGKSSVDAINKTVIEQKPYIDLLDRTASGLKQLGIGDRLTPNALASPELRTVLSQLDATQLQNPKALEGLGRYTPLEAETVANSFKNWRTNPDAAVAALKDMTRRSHETVFQTYKQHFVSPTPQKFHMPLDLGLPGQGRK